MQYLLQSQVPTSLLTLMLLSHSESRDWENIMKTEISILRYIHTFGGRISMVIIYGTGKSPIEATKIVNDNPYIGTQLLSGNSALYNRCKAKTSIPIPAPNDDIVNKILRPTRSIKNIVRKLAHNWTTQIKIDDWMGVKVDPASAKNGVVYESSM